MSLQLPNRPSVSHSSREEHEEDPSEWGFDEAGEDGVDFKKKIADLTHRAHGSHFFPSGSGGDHDSHDAVMNALDGIGFDELDIEEEGDGSIEGGDSIRGTNGDSSMEWKMGADEWQMRNREFSTVVWQTNDDAGGNGWTQSSTPRHEDSSHKSSSLSTTHHSSSNSVASSASLPSDTSCLPTATSSSRSASISNGSALSEHGATRTHPPTPTASSAALSSTASISITTAAAAVAAPHHHSSNSFSAAGSGRNLSLDSSARALGINILYVERLALPLLRSEIHSFFSKLLIRLHALLHLMETDPVLLLQRSQEGMRGNMLQATDEELRRNFLQSIEQLQHQIDEIRAAQSANGNAAIINVGKKPVVTVDGALPLSASSSSSSSSESPPQPSTSPLSTQQLLLSISPSALLAPSPTPSPAVSPAHANNHATPSTTGHHTQYPSHPPLSQSSKSTSRSSAAHTGNGSSSSSTSASLPPHPDWWPPSLVSSYASLQRMRELFLMIKLGFDDATSNTGATAASTTPISTTVTATATLKSRLSGGGSVSLFSAKLQALPTTHSNRDGLSTLARIMQSFSRLVALEGGSIQAASRLALCFQRLANTMLEKHGVEEPKWSQSKHA